MGLRAVLNKVFLKVLPSAAIFAVVWPAQVIAEDILPPTAFSTETVSHGQSELAREVKSLKVQNSSSDYQLPSLNAFTAQEVLKVNHTYERFGSFYRGLVRMEDYLDLNLLRQVEDDQRLAQSVFLYQSGRELAKLALDAPVGEYIKKSLKKLVWIRDLTTLAVHKNNEGRLSINSRSKSNGEALAWFKVHLSPKRGLEPRLRVLESVTVSYDFLESAALLEFEKNF